MVWSCFAIEVSGSQTLIVQRPLDDMSKVSTTSTIKLLESHQQNQYLGSYSPHRNSASIMMYLTNYIPLISYYECKKSNL